MDNLLACLAGNQTPPSPGSIPEGRSDYLVTPISGMGGAIGLNIERLVAYEGSLEASGLYLKENDPNIQRTVVQVDRPNLIAKIRIFDVYDVDPQPRQAPEGGWIKLILNRHPFTVQTGSWMSREEILGALEHQIATAGTVESSPPYIVVTSVLGQPPTRIEFISYDHGIIQSEIRLDRIPPVITPGGEITDLGGIEEQ
jgi:hypothetical protein